MPTQILKGLKIILLLELAVWVVFGVFFTFFIHTFADWIDWPVTDPTAGRYIGVIFLSFAFITFIAYREKDWERIELFIILDVIICISGGIIQLLGIFLDGTGWAGWLFFAIQMVFFVLVLYFYIQQQKQ
ncbi:MAG: hypothetical protein ACFFFB_04220 [Candidatus Heimdallarchaeota archaeon]